MRSPSEMRACHVGGRLICDNPPSIDMPGRIGTSFSFYGRHQSERKRRWEGRAAARDTRRFTELAAKDYEGKYLEGVYVYVPVFIHRL